MKAKKKEQKKESVKENDCRTFDPDTYTIFASSYGYGKACIDPESANQLFEEIKRVKNFHQTLKISAYNIIVDFKNVDIITTNFIDDSICRLLNESVTCSHEGKSLLWLTNLGENKNKVLGAINNTFQHRYDVDNEADSFTYSKSFKNKKLNLGFEPKPDDIVLVI